MKKLLLLFCVILVANACTRTKTEYYDNGAVKSVIQYKCNKENGHSVYFRPDGSKALEIDMHDGKKEGKLIRWFSNNVPETIAHYRNDSLEGNLTVYDRKGFPLSSIEYRNGKKNGLYQSWHARDLLREKGFFTNDLYDGEWEYYDKRGVLVGEASFSLGSGTQTGYDAFGNLMRITQYVKNQKEGCEIHFATNGDTTLVIHYHNDRIVTVDSLNAKR